MLSTVLLIKLGLFVLYLVVRLTRRSTMNSLPALAERRGWRYHTWEHDLPKPYQGTPFGEGYNRTVQNVLTGSHRGRTITAFEYAFVAGTGRKQETQVYTVVAVDTPAECPMLEVSRDGEVRTEDDQFTADVLHPTTLDWMAGDERAKAFPIRFHRDTVISWEAGMLDIGRMLAMLDYLCDHLDRVPQPVWS